MTSSLAESPTSKSPLTLYQTSPAPQTTLLSPQYKQPALSRPQNISRLIFILCLLNMTSFYCGYCISYIAALGIANNVLVYGQVINYPIFRGFLISSVPFGVALGAYLAIWIMPLIARRRLAFVLACCGVVLQTLIQVNNVQVFFVCRSLQGVVTGLFLMLVPVYVRQISPKEINKKGIFGVITNLFLVMGITGSFLFNRILLESKVNQIARWRCIVSFNAIFVVLIIICILFDIIPESPNSLIQAGNDQQAKQVIGIFHRQKFIDQIFNQKLKQMQAMKKPAQQPNPQNPKQQKLLLIKTFLTFQVPIMQQLTGANAFIAQMGYLTTRFNRSFGPYVPLIMGMTQFLSALFSMYYLYRFDRKKMLLIGNLGTSLCCFGLAITFVFLPEYSNGIWIVLALIITFMIFNGLMIVPSVPLYLPTVGTKRNLQLSQVTNWLACGVAIDLFVTIQGYSYFSVMFFVFGSVTFIFFIFNYTFMTETKLDIKKIVNDQLRIQNLQLMPIQRKQELYN